MIRAIPHRDREQQRTRDRDRALAAAGNLAHALSAARDTAHDLDRTLDRTLDGTHARAAAHTIDPGLARARARDLAAARDLAHAAARDLDQAHLLALNLAATRARDFDHIDRDLARDLATARDLAATLKGVRTSARDRARARARVRDCALTRATARGLDRDLARTVDGAVTFIAASERALTWAHGLENSRAPGNEPTRSAVRVARMAWGLLPRQDRDRYAEEYRGELAELAAAGAGRWWQLRHSVHLLARAGELRVALAGARRRRKTTR